MENVPQVFVLALNRSGMPTSRQLHSNEMTASPLVDDICSCASHINSVNCVSRINGLPTQGQHERWGLHQGSRVLQRHRQPFPAQIMCVDIERTVLVHSIIDGACHAIKNRDKYCQASIVACLIVACPLHRGISTPKSIHRRPDYDCSSAKTSLIS